MWIGIHIGTAAQQIGAIIQCLAQQFLGPGIVKQAFLGEDANLDIHCPGIIGLKPLDGVKARQADARIDFDMGAHRIGALGNCLFNHTGTAGVNVILGKAAFGVGDGTDRALKRAGFVFGPVQNAGLIKVDVAFHKAAAEQLTSCIKAWRIKTWPIAGNRLADLDNFSIRHGKIDKRILTGQAGVPHQIIKHSRVLPVSGFYRWGLYRPVRHHPNRRQSGVHLL